MRKTPVPPTRGNPTRPQQAFIALWAGHGELIFLYKMGTLGQQRALDLDARRKSLPVAGAALPGKVWGRLRF